MSSTTDPSDAVSLQGHYAGPVTRLLGYVVDQSLMIAAFAGGTAVVVWGVSLITSGEVQWTASPWVTAAAFVLWQFLYYAYPWAVSGRRPAWRSSASAWSRPRVTPPGRGRPRCAPSHCR